MAESEESNSSGHSEQPIIIKKIKKGGHGHHGGAWKVAYADFVTAMMAFFIVMWIFASNQEVKEAVADYFQNPENYDVFTGEPTSPVVVSLFDDKAPGKGKGDGGNESGLFQFEDSNKNATDSVLMNEQIYQAIQDSIAYAKQVEQTGENLQKTLDELEANSSSEEMKKILSSIEIEITQDGMRIELLESHDNNFFEIGSATLKPDAVSVLKQLAKQIGRLGNYTEIEGHTDSRGYASTTGYTNWELSADRANSARKILESNGFFPGQIISVAGFADRKLRNPTNPFDYSNRRVSIVVKNLSASEFIRDK